MKMEKIMEFKTYICTDHDSHYPVGSASVVNAKSKNAAILLLDKELIANGLKPFELYPYTLKIVKDGQAIVLCNGDY